VEFLPAQVGLPLDLVTNILGLWVLAALYLRQREASGLLGALAYALKSFGLALVIGFLFTQAFVFTRLDAAQAAALLAGPAGLAAVIGLGITTIGALLFGIASLRAGVLPLWAAVLLMVGFLVVPAGVVAPAIKTGGEFVLSAGLAWLSLWLFRDAARTMPTALRAN
jgi:hypothetical protein